MQVANEGTIKLANLECREVFGAHNAVKLQSWIREIQQDYKIKDEQILAISIDSDKNIAATADGQEIDESSSGDLENEVHDQNFAALHGLDSSIFAEIIFNEDVNVKEEPAEDGAIEFVDMESHSTDEDIASTNRVHCVFHKLQLAVNKFLARRDVQKILQVARELAVKLRTSIIRGTLISENLGVPELDQPSKLCSTARMLDQVLKLKDFCKSNVVSAPGNYN